MSILLFTTWIAQGNKVAVTFISKRTEVLSGLKHFTRKKKKKTKLIALIKVVQDKGNSGNKWYTSWHFTHRASNSPTKFGERKLRWHKLLHLLLQGIMVRKVCSKAVCFSRVWKAWANMKQILVHSSTKPTSSLCCVTLHIYTKRGGFLQQGSGKFWVTLKSTSLEKLQLHWTQQANWNNWKLNKQRHVGCEIWSAAEAFCWRKRRSFFFFF